MPVSREGPAGSPSGGPEPSNLDLIMADSSSSRNAGSKLSVDGFQDVGLEEAPEGIDHESVDFPLDDRFQRAGGRNP